MSIGRLTIAAFLLVAGAETRAANVVIMSDPANAAVKVYSVVMTGGSEQRSLFSVQDGAWLSVVPLAPPQPRSIIIRYPPGLGPETMRLSILVSPAAPEISLTVPRPRPRSECDLSDQKDVAYRTQQRSEAQDAAGIIVQIDHLLIPNREFPCASAVEHELKRLRDDNLRYLRSRIPAIRDMNPG